MPQKAGEEPDGQRANGWQQRKYLVLMEPNDQYLGIIPTQGVGSSQREQIFLPFESDYNFSVILSKAFLLAEDKKITNTKIIRQIEPSINGL
jgi:hypothetical protein